MKESTKRYLILAFFLILIFVYFIFPNNKIDSRLFHPENISQISVSCGEWQYTINDKQEIALIAKYLKNAKAIKLKNVKANIDHTIYIGFSLKDGSNTDLRIYNNLYDGRIVGVGSKDYKIDSLSNVIKGCE